MVSIDGFIYSLAILRQNFNGKTKVALFACNYFIFFLLSHSRPGDPFIISTVKGLLAGVRALVKDVDQWGLCQVYLKSLQILSTAAWSTYPYHIGKQLTFHNLRKYDFKSRSLTVKKLLMNDPCA